MDGHYGEEADDMKTIQALAFAGLLALALPPALTACASPPPSTPRVVTDAEAGVVHLARGQALEIRLPLNAGTGYAWRLDREAPLAVLSGGSSHDTATDRPGGPIATVFTYRGAGRGEARLAFTLKRPWEPDRPGDRKAVFTVKVR